MILKVPLHRDQLENHPIWRFHLMTETKIFKHLTLRLSCALRSFICYQNLKRGPLISLIVNQHNFCLAYSFSYSVLALPIQSYHQFQGLRCIQLYLFLLLVCHLALVSLVDLTVSLLFLLVSSLEAVHSLASLAILYQNQQNRRPQHLIFKYYNDNEALKSLMVMNYFIILCLP